MSDPSPTSAVPSASASSSSSPFPTESSSSDSFFDFSAPASWIFIPIILLVFVVASLSCLTVRRRRRRRIAAANAAWPGHSPYDPERGGSGGPHTRGGPYSARARRARPWAARSSEGLNELGEAPPAYEPKAKPGRGLADDDNDSNGVELQQFEHRPDAGAPSSPSVSSPPPHLSSAGTHLPPDYSTVGAGGAPASPPPLITIPQNAVSRH
ncbi:hypothetical protein ACHAQA_001935 [Verticillium albo-atrum]